MISFQPPEPSLAEHKWWWNLTVSEIKFRKFVLQEGLRCPDAVEIMTANNIQQMLITNDEKETHVVGVISMDIILSKLISGEALRTDLAKTVMDKEFTKISTSSTLGQLFCTLEKKSYVVIINDDNILVGLAILSDIYNFIIKYNNCYTT